MLPLNIKPRTHRRNVHPLTDETSDFRRIRALCFPD